MNMTGRCNIRCIYCHLTYSEYYSNSEMSLATFKKLRPFFDTLSHLVYFSSTEPLVATNFKEIFAESASISAEKYLSTNAILLNEQTAHSFVRDGLFFLTVSMAGMTRESFSKHHQVDALSLVTRNIEFLNSIKKKLRIATPRLRLVFVTWKDNAHELPLAVEYAHRHQFSEGVKITYLKIYSDNMADQLPYDHLDHINHWVRTAQEYGKKLGVPVTFDGGNFDGFKECNTEDFHRPCHEPFKRFHVEADGGVRTCASPTNTLFAGHLDTQTLDEIWNGPVFQEFRRRVNTTDPPDPCRRCVNNFRKNFLRRDIWDQRDMDLGIYRRFPEGKSLLKRG
ncbi:MAG: radical SAM/SPASM domain-containing protein [Thermodesulfobacteriota bacterium]